MEFCEGKRRFRERAWGSSRQIKGKERAARERKREKERVLERVRAPPRTYVRGGNVRDVPAGRITKLISRPLNSTPLRQENPSPSGRMLLFACDFPVGVATDCVLVGHFIALPRTAGIFFCVPRISPRSDCAASVFRHQDIRNLSRCVFQAENAQSGYFSLLNRAERNVWHGVSSSG